MPWMVALVALCSLALESPPARADVPRYEITATVDPARRTITGKIQIHTRAHGKKLLFHLYPNRFRADGPEVDDTTRSYVYPRQNFDPGGIEIHDVFWGEAHRSLPFETLSPAELAPKTILEIELPSERRDGVSVEISFTTYLPKRFGPFGVTDQGLTAVGGWHPYLVARDTSHGWHPDWSPPPANMALAIQAPPERSVVLGNSIFSPGHSGSLRASASGVRNMALLLPRAPDIVENEVEATTLLFVEPHEPLTSRIGGDPAPDSRFREVVRSALEKAPPSLPVPPKMTIAQVPLRWNLTTPSDAPLIASDRALHVHPVLEGFHAAQIAQAVYAQLLRKHVLQCEPPGQQSWVQQGVAWYLADQFLAAVEPEHQSLNQWLQWLDFIAIIDRFESAPKIPFASAFFENSLSEDELRESIFSFARKEPPARLSFARLDRSLGEKELDAALARYVAAIDGPCITFAEVLADAVTEKPAAVEKSVGIARAPIDGVAPRARVDTSLLRGTQRSEYQFVLDNADIDVSSSEFGVGFLFLLRKRYDYTKDLAILPYFNERAYGIRIGPRFHFGRRNEPRNYQQNAFLYYQISGLDTGFRDDARPDLRYSGGVGGFGFRYSYSNVYWFNNPTEKRSLRFFLDGYDPALGGDYSFIRYGLRLRGTTKLGSPNTIAAMEILAGFENSFSKRGVPIQEQYSLGGQRSIRGISVNEELGRNIGLVRFELRQNIYPAVDLNLLDFLAYRRPQVRLFLDAGNVDGSAGRALNPSHWALGAGIGVNVLYEFLGFFPGSAYMEIATRLDENQGDVQVLFGTRQAF